MVYVLGLVVNKLEVYFYKIFLKHKVGSLAPIGEESPQRNKVKRGLGTESGTGVSQELKSSASKRKFNIY